MFDFQACCGGARTGKKKSLIGRAYRKVTKSRSGKNKKSGGAEEDGVAAAGGVAGGGA